MTTSLSERPNRIDSCDWTVVQGLIGIPAGSMFEQSHEDPGRRIYFLRSEVIKVVVSSVQISSALRRQDLQGEAAILRRLASIQYVPNIIEYRRLDKVEWLRLERVHGRSVADAGITVRVFGRLVGVLVRIARQGVAHNDVTENNILVTAANLPFIIDFDQAEVVGIRAALKTNLLGMSGEMVKTGLLGLLKRRVERRLPERARRNIRRLMRRKHVGVPPLPPNAGAKLAQIHTAWRIGEKSDASSPGVGQAYYEYEFEGFVLPGERPWIPRWNVLAQMIDLNGMRVLELGCNLGLLSTFSLLRGAVSATATDMDSQILTAASLVASAHDVAPKFMQVDFDVNEKWEERFAKEEFDVVFALNVLNWVREKDRLLRFLSRYPTLVYEGHDSLALESQRLRRVGFEIGLTSTSERNRPIILATRGR